MGGDAFISEDYIPRETIEKLHAASKKINPNVGGRYAKGLW